MIKTGDRVTIKPEYRDAGDELYTWVAVDDEEKGRVTIAPIDIGLAIIPRYVVQIGWIEKQ